jgi:hypothetical protein
MQRGTLCWRLDWCIALYIFNLSSSIDIPKISSIGSNIEFIWIFFVSMFFMWNRIDSSKMCSKRIDLIFKHILIVDIFIYYTLVFGHIKNIYVTCHGLEITP